jgi:excisionase family DNA binding protein
MNVFRRCDMQNEEIIKIKDIAALLKVGEKTVYSMAQSGELPAFKVRGQWRFSKKDIDEWIEQQKKSSQDLRDEK